VNIKCRCGEKQTARTMTMIQLGDKAVGRIIRCLECDFRVLAYPEANPPGWVKRIKQLTMGGYNRVVSELDLMGKEPVILEERGKEGEKQEAESTETDS